MERISNNTTNLDGLGVKSNMLIYIYKPKGKIVTVRTKKRLTTVSSLILCRNINYL